MEPVTITLTSEGQVSDIDFVQWIMNEIEDPNMTRREVAHSYGILIQKGHKDWGRLNNAILTRWSPSGLRWIKESAHKRVAMERAAWERHGGCTCMGQSECDFCEEMMAIVVQGAK